MHDDADDAPVLLQGKHRHRAEALAPCLVAPAERVAPVDRQVDVVGPVRPDGDGEEPGLPVGVSGVSETPRVGDGPRLGCGVDQRFSLWGPSGLMG